MHACQDINASNVFTENSDTPHFYWFEHIAIVNSIKKGTYMACKCIFFEKPCSDVIFFES